MNSSQLSLTSVESLSEIGSDICDGSLKNRITEDWANREFVESITKGIQKIGEFLNEFESCCRVKLASLNQKLTQMEKMTTYLEENLINHKNSDEHQQNPEESDSKST